MEQVQLLEKTPEVPIITHVQAPVQVGNFRTIHHFVVVDHLIYHIIRGIAFLQQNELMLHFTYLLLYMELYHDDQAKVL